MASAIISRLSTIEKKPYFGLKQQINNKHKQYFGHHHPTMMALIPVRGSSWWNGTDGLRQKCFCNSSVEYNSLYQGYVSHLVCLKIFWIYTDASLSAANCLPAKHKKSSGGVVKHLMLGQLSPLQNLLILTNMARSSIGLCLESLKKQCFTKKPRIPSQSLHQPMKQQVQLIAPHLNNHG